MASYMTHVYATKKGRWSFLGNVDGKIVYQGGDYATRDEAALGTVEWMRSHSCYPDAEEVAAKRTAQLVEALKLAYRKHHLGDDSVGSSELSDAMMNALCEAMGDKEFQAWLKTTTW